MMIYKVLLSNNMRLTASIIKKYRKLKFQITKIYEDLLFLKKCRSENVFPNFIKIYSSIQNSRSENVIHKAKRSWLYNEINFKYSQIQRINFDLYTLYGKITYDLENSFLNLWFDEVLNINIICERIKNEKRSVLSKKFTTLSNNQIRMCSDKPPLKQNFIVNYSNINLTEEEKDILNNGLKHRIAPKIPPIQDIVVNIESSLRCLNLVDNKKNEIRFEVKKVLDEFNDRNIIHDKKELTLINQLRMKDIFIMKPDKGKGVVLMNKDDYENRMISTINDGPYSTLNIDGRWKNGSPLNKMQNDVLNLLKDLKNKNICNNFFTKSLIVSNPKVPVMYGLPKTHKIGRKMRPIISNIRSPTSKIARWTVKTFESLNYPKGFSIQNSVELVSKLKDIKMEDDEILVSFDIVGLYPNVPLPEAFEAIEHYLSQANITMERKEMLTRFVDICMKQNIFQLRGKFYQQTSGLSMGNSASPMVAQFFMNKFETEIKHEVWFPRIWFRYVDDIIAIVKKDEATNILNELNSKYPTIKFTMESEDNDSIPFLDLRLSRLNNEIEFDIYRKPTDNQLMINATSFHHQSHKHAAIHSMMHRLFNIPISPMNFKKELDYIKETCKLNGYQDKIINQIFIKHKRKSERINATSLKNVPTTDEINSNFLGLPYYGNLTEKIKRKLKPFNIRVAYQNPGKLSDLIGSTKDKNIDELAKSGIYQLSCADCDAIYIGQTKRNIGIRRNEHINDCFKPENPESAMAYHCITKSHSIRNVSLLKEVHDTYKLDSWESLQLKLNEDENLTNLNKFGNSPSILFNYCKKS